MRQLAAGEEVGEELHGVGAQACDVLVPARRGGGALGAEGGDAVLDVLGHLGADLEAEDQFGGEEGGEGDEEAAEAAADVGDCDGLGRGGGGAVGGEGVGVWCGEGGVVGGPVHECWACGARKRRLVSCQRSGGGGGAGGLAMSIGGRRRGWRGLAAGRISSGEARRCLLLCGFCGNLGAFGACLLLSL